MKLVPKTVNQLNDNNLRIKGLVRWKFSTKLSFRIFSLENFTNNELILSLNWERIGMSIQVSVCQVFPQKNEYLTRLLHMQGNELTA